MIKLLVYVMTFVLFGISGLCAQENYQINLTSQEKSWLEQNRTLKIGVLNEAYPYEFLGEDNKYYGLSSDYAKIWAQNLNIVFEVVPLKNWQEAAQFFRDKKIDVLPLMIKKDIYNSGLIFSNNYVSSSLGIFSFGNATFINNLDDVINQKIAVAKEIVEHTQILDGKKQNLVLYDNALKAMEAANRGETDFYIGEILNAKYMIDKKNMTHLNYVAPVVGSAFDFGLATTPDKSELISAINKVLAEIKPITHSDIRRKWTSQHYSQQELIIHFVSYIILMIIFFAALIFMLIYRNYRLRKRALRLSQMQKMESIGRMAGGLAHDFNNMLSGILGASESLAMRLDVNSPLLKYTDIIEQASERLASLTSELLVFAREKDKKYEVLDLHNIINKSIRLLESGLQKKYCVQLNMNAESNYILANQDLIESLILNLGVNARDAMGKDGCIEVNTKNIELNKKSQEDFLLPFKTGEYIEMEVKDGGSGIPLVIQNKIFDPFFTTKEIGKGTGLGLAAVYGIVRDHKGTIRFTTSEKGTSFFVYLPVVDKQEIVVKENVNKIKLKAKILIVDDEKILLELLKDILISFGAEVITTNDSLQAELLYNQNSDIDVVMLDVIMPNKSGVEIYENLRAKNHNLKMVLMSGYSQDNKIDELLANDERLVFMGKPYRISKCQEILHKLLSVN